MSAHLTADQVADHFIALAHERGERLSNLKLQKLLYYAQAWHLALHDEPLFPEKFQAWISGPVIPAIYCRFDEFGIRDIAAPERKPELAPAIRKFLESVADTYLPLDVWTLDRMTRREMPWIAARGGLDVDEPCSTVIDEQQMRNSSHRPPLAA